MRKIVVSEFITLDGVFEDPGGSEKTKFGGWSFDFNSAEAMKYKYDELMAADDLLLGRITYEGFAEAWPKMKGTGEFGEKMNSIPKHVVSSTISKLHWNNSQFIKGDLVKKITELKKQSGKNILVAGSGQLVRSLIDNNLVDELCLMVSPVILGTGKQLFSALESRKNLELVSVKKFPKGTVVLTYSPLKK